MRNGRAVRLKRRPDTFEVPAVCHEACSQSGVADDPQCFRKFRMKRRFAPGEVDPRNVGGGMGFGDHTSQQFERKEFGV